MKKTILSLALTTFIAGTVLVGCKESSKKEEAAQENVQDARADLDDAKEELSEAKRAATEQVKGLKEIFTSKINAKKSQDFSKRNNELYKEVNKLVSETKFEKIPKGAIVKGTKEYKERKQKGEVPKKAIVGVKDVTYNQISNASSSDKHRMKGEAPRNNMEKVLLKKEWYFNKK